MKVFIIHTHHSISIKYANNALRSFNNYSGYEPELFEGLTLETLSNFEKENKITHQKNSRAADFYKQDKKIYKIKKCCSLNHYRIFKICISLNEPVIVIEHDTECVSNWTYPVFDDILVLNFNSALKQDCLQEIKRKNINPIYGINDIDVGLYYKHNPKIKNAHMMLGTAAYAINPEAAATLVDIYETYGWEQSDHIINTNNVRIQTIVPELFTLKLPNLCTSHGRNLK